MVPREARIWPWGLCCALQISVPAACSEHTAAAPAQPTAAASKPAPASTEVGPSVAHVVQEGETLWEIARAYGVGVDAILSASGLDKSKERQLSKGATLRIPGATAVIDVAAHAAKADVLPALSDGAYHRMQEGESLWEVARLYDVPIEALMERNRLTDDDIAKVRIGQAVIVPGIKQSQVKRGEPKAKPRGFVRTVEKGETVWDIAHAYRVGVSALMAANRLTEDEANNLRDGSRLFIPGVEDDGKGHVRRRTTARERRAETVARRLGLGSIRAAGSLLHGRVEERWIRAASQLGRFPGTLKWPVANGWFVRGYGSGQGGYHKAMDIMGKMGWHVRAAAPGIVGYSGDKVPGFGNMVMVVHPGGWVTLYAHNSVNFVAAGENVVRGTVLAEVGSTGRSQGPHVHFELIEGNNNCDPAPLFRPGVRRRTGKFMRVEQASWRNPDKRPQAVRCARRQKHPMAQAVINENPLLDIVPEAEHGPEMEAPLPAPDDEP